LIFKLSLLEIGPKSFRRADIIKSGKILGKDNGSDQDPWYIVIDNKVYDIKDFVPDHPGGAVILTHIGKDSTGNTI
jgi:acyl-lipid Delta6-acetylenase / acyl-lipid (9-3)-desaturase